MTTECAETSGLHLLLEKNLPNWWSIRENQDKIYQLPKNKINALTNLLQTEIIKTRQFNLTASRFEKLKHFDFELNQLACELINCLQYPSKGSQESSILFESNFFNLDNAESHINSITTTLNSRGYCLSPFSLPKEKVNCILKELSSCSFSTRTAEERTLKGKEILELVDNSKKETLPNGTYWLDDQNQLVHKELFFKLAFDPFIIAVVSNYLKCPPIHVQTNAWFSFPSKKQRLNLSRNALLYHQDKEYIKFIKVFIYLSDVGPFQGPHSYIESSHLDELHKKGPDLSTRIIDRKIKKYYASERIQTVTGPSGLVVFGDTSCVHKGSPVIEGYRVMLQLEYCSSLYQSAIKPFDDLSPELISLLPFDTEVVNRLISNYSTQSKLAFENLEKELKAKNVQNFINFLKRIKKVGKNLLLNF